MSAREKIAAALDDIRDCGARAVVMDIDGDSVVADYARERLADAERLLEEALEALK